MIRLMTPWASLPYLIEWFNGNYLIAGLTAALLLIILCKQQLKRGAIMECGGLAALSGMPLTSLYYPTLADAEYTKSLMYGVVSALGWHSILRGSPFTLIYSRPSASSGVAESVEFFRINNTISKVWSTALLLNFGFSLLTINLNWYWPLFLLGSYSSLLAASVFTEQYPAFYNRRYSHGPTTPL